MTELERRALLGDKTAQEECTDKGIILPCPFCGGSAELIEKDGLYSVACKDGNCIASDIHPEYGETMVAISDWNTRPTPPIGRCVECEWWDKNTRECWCAADIARAYHKYTEPDYFCGDFAQEEGEENG